MTMRAKAIDASGAIGVWTHLQTAFWGITFSLAVPDSGLGLKSRIHSDHVLLRTGWLRRYVRRASLTPQTRGCVPAPVLDLVPRSTDRPALIHHLDVRDRDQCSQSATAPGFH